MALCSHANKVHLFWLLISMQLSRSGRADDRSADFQMSFMRADVIFAIKSNAQVENSIAVRALSVEPDMGDTRASFVPLIHYEI